MRQKDWFVADFETKNEDFYNENGFTEVWLYAISNPQGEIVNYGENIEQFIDYCKKELSNCIVYFHNLRFDGSFIINYLIRNNYKYLDKIEYNSGKSYNTLISEEGQFYSIKVHFKRGVTVDFNDSLKIIPFPVKTIAKAFNLPMEKEKIDYGDYTVNEDTLRYVFNDVKIVALALQQLKEKGFCGMTAASSAYKWFISQCEGSDILFPDLDEEMLLEWRGAYRGGRSQVNPMYAGKVYKNVRRYDVNSMYPSIMRNCWLPIGQPKPITERGKYRFEMYKVSISFVLKEGHLPTLLKKNTVFGEQSYYTETEGVEILYISSIDYELLERHYDIDYVNFEEMYGFNTSNQIFCGYIDYWYDIKSHSTGAMKQLAKLMLNSLYGKFGSNPVGKNKTPSLDPDGALTFKIGEEQPRKKYYLFMAIAITSYAHKLIDDAIMATGVENFIYCDTDSVHTLGILPDNLIDQKQLGLFKLEAVETRSKYVRQKTYVYAQMEDDGQEHIYITCAGMNDASKIYALNLYGNDIFDEFKPGFTVEGYKLMPKQVPGGVVLVKSKFMIKEK